MAADGRPGPRPRVVPLRTPLPTLSSAEPLLISRPVRVLSIVLGVAPPIAPPALVPPPVVVPPPVAEVGVPTVDAAPVVGTAGAEALVVVLPVVLVPVL